MCPRRTSAPPKSSEGLRGARAYEIAAPCLVQALDLATLCLCACDTSPVALAEVHEPGGHVFVEAFRREIPKLGWQLLE